MRGNVTPSSFLAVHFSTTMRFVVLRVDEDAAAFSSVGSGRICQACCFHFVYAALLELLPLSEHTAHKLGVTSYFFLFSNSTPLPLYNVCYIQQPAASPPPHRQRFQRTELSKLLCSRVLLLPSIHTND